MFNTEMFIIEVQKRPCLWNMNHSSYAEKELKAQAWEEIAEILNSVCGRYSFNYNTITAVAIQRKWKHLRDYYVREKKRASKVSDNSAPSCKKRKSPLLDMLQFLDVNRENESTVQSYTDNINTDEHNYFKETNEDETKNISEHEQLGPNSVHNPKTNERRPNLNESGEENEDESDKQFLTSLLPLIKNMSSKEKNYILKRLMNPTPADETGLLSEDETVKGTAVEMRKRTRTRHKQESDDNCKVTKKNEANLSSDEYAIYGQYVANKLRNIPNAYARNTAEFNINKILYKAEMGEYDVVTRREPKCRASSPVSVASSNARDIHMRQVDTPYSQDMSSDDEVLSHKVYIVKNEVDEGI